MFEDRPWQPWRDYSCQVGALRLKPWESPPCHVYYTAPDNRDGMKQGLRDARAGDLADRLMAAGLSIYEPDPAAALARAEKRGERRRAAGF